MDELINHDKKDRTLEAAWRGKKKKHLDIHPARCPVKRGRGGDIREETST